MSDSQVTVRIDGIELSVPEGTLIVDAAKRAGIDIPVFCYHPKMEPAGMCRMCLVEVGTPQVDRGTGERVKDEDGNPVINMWPKLATACTTPVSDGMVVEVGSGAAVQGRNEIVEYLLTSHPLDCPVCDKGGECPLQNLTMEHGPGKSRFIYEDKIDLAKHVPLGDLIFLDRERCIQCGRCVRFQQELVDDPVIGFSERGRSLEVVTFSVPGFDSYFSGNTSDICPVGALTTADFRFGARPWEMNSSASICPHCPVGCNLTLNTRREAKSGGAEVIKRVMPRQNEFVNEIWICDKGRFAHAYAVSQDRITRPMIRENGELVEASWDEAYRKAAEGLRSARGGVVGLASGRLSNEDLFNLRSLLDGIGGSVVLYDAVAGGEYVQRYGLSAGSNIADLGPDDAILVAATDLHEEAPIWWMRVKGAAERGAALIVANGRETRLDKHASSSLRTSYFEPLAAVSGLLDRIKGSKAGTGDESTTRAAEAIKSSGRLVIFFGREGLSPAGQDRMAHLCASILTESGHSDQAGSGLVPVWPHVNTQGAYDMGFRPHPSGWAEAVSQAAALYIAGADPLGDDPQDGGPVGKKTFLIVQDIFMTATAARADVVFPAQTFVEREGTYTSAERRVQRFYPALPARGETKADWQITAELASHLEIELEGASAAAVFLKIADAADGYSGLTYQLLSQYVEQWPSVGGEDLYFGGTSYRNLQGIGVQLPAGEAGVPGPPPPDSGKIDKPHGAKLLLVPVTYLYDHGQLIAEADILQSRLTPEKASIHPADAGKLKLEHGAITQISLNGASCSLPVDLDSHVPEGVIIVGRNQGVPFTSPTVVELKPDTKRGSV
jgi:NADH-quinone oxidoreductase subunit G